MRAKYAEPDAPLKSNAGMPSAPGSIDRFAAPAAPHSRRCFGKPLPPQTESCDVRTVLLFSAAGRAEEVTAFHLTSRPAFPQAFRETAPAANRKLRCADGLALQRGRASGGTPRQPPHIPAGVAGNTFHRNPEVAMRGRNCSSAWQYERTNPLRKPPHIPAGVAGNRFGRNPKAAMCGRPCFSARQGERRNTSPAAPAFPQVFRETHPAAIRKLRCADGLALQCGRASV